MGSIELKAAEKWYGDVQVIKGIDLQIDGLTPDSAAAVRKHIADRSTTFTDSDAAPPAEAAPVDG